MNEGCYCGKIEPDCLMLTCDGCNNKFHIDCLKTGKPTALQGDIFFHLRCSNCGQNGQEEIERSKLPWVTIVSLALYNLQLSGTGKQGYFRWKEHVCAYIDKHWSILLGPHKKKTSLWYGTVAGALSSGCPKHFQSGSKELGEAGWWRLTEMKAPVYKPTEIVNRKVKRQDTVCVLQGVKVEGLRSRNKKSSIESAIELKNKRLQTKEIKKIKKEQLAEKETSSFDEQPIVKKSNLTGGKMETQLSIRTKTRATGGQAEAQLALTTETYAAASEMGAQLSVKTNTQAADVNFSTMSTDNIQIKEEPIELNTIFTTDNDNQFLLSSSNNNEDLLTDAALKPKETLPSYLFQSEDECDSDLEIDPGGISPDEAAVFNNDFLSLHDILSTIPDKLSNYTSVCEKTVLTIKTETKEDSDEDIMQSESDNDDSQTEEKMDEDDDKSNVSEESIIVPLRNKINQEVEEIKPEPMYKAISLYDERLLLNRLNLVAEKSQLSHEVCRFRRKLIVRQLKRERGIRLFDLDHEVNKSLNLSIQKDTMNVPYTRFPHGDLRVLDRFTGGVPISLHLEPEKPSFLNRLVGTEDDQLQSIRSPYTTRILKPFIRRDYESRPIKMQLLQEIKAYPHRNNCNWKGSTPPPIDYCYVRPQHIPSVNILCQQFFWPGIDLSECLHYPDFSCVVLFRKIVIGFAFMVPDVKYNEAYISFIFTHPEWRRAGIAKFMIYHLIQTCMGKDVTLHVSATNPAMLLYQKFGFKPEEFMLDFYDKYYHLNSKECKHAFFLRLRR